jgi:DNA replicative helicase MCM subunit Mcm2 (Cdc46/Mcm family)
MDAPRQLEAIIRISESLAKITLSQSATEAHVEEAVQLFKESTEVCVHVHSTIYMLVQLEENTGDPNKHRTKHPSVDEH